jgi:hypothetical protein
MDKWGVIATRKDSESRQLLGMTLKIVRCLSNRTMVTVASHRVAIARQRRAPSVGLAATWPDIERSAGRPCGWRGAPTIGTGQKGRSPPRHPSRTRAAPVEGARPRRGDHHGRSGGATQGAARPPAAPQARSDSTPIGGADRRRVLRQGSRRDRPSSSSRTKPRLSLGVDSIAIIRAEPYGLRRGFRSAPLDLLPDLLPEWVPNCRSDDRTIIRN